MVAIYRNVGLDDAATSMQTSTVDEPSVAAAGRQVFVTGNWFASRSGTSGNSWTHIDPFTALPSAAGGFCCDQLALYEPGHKIWVWLLQYIATGGGNIFRIAVARSSNGPWAWWDFAPSGLDAQWTNMWFDYPDAAFSTNHLYLTFNAFDSGDNWLRAFAFRMPLADLAARGSLGFQWWTTTSHGSLRLTQGATTDMYFASHNAGRTLRVFPLASHRQYHIVRCANVRLGRRTVQRSRAGRQQLADTGGLAHYGRLARREPSRVHVDGFSDCGSAATVRQGGHRGRTGTHHRRGAGHLEPGGHVGLSRGRREWLGPGWHLPVLRHQPGASGTRRGLEECQLLGHSDHCNLESRASGREMGRLSLLPPTSFARPELGGVGLHTTGRHGPHECRAALRAFWALSCPDQGDQQPMRADWAAKRGNFQGSTMTQRHD
jgi:hypothetical protein